MTEDCRLNLQKERPESIWDGDDLLPASTAVGIGYDLEQRGAEKSRGVLVPVGERQTPLTPLPAGTNSPVTPLILMLLPAQIPLIELTCNPTLCHSE